jgi:PIN domain nuclease of toxin-antitoxin system
VRQLLDTHVAVWAVGPAHRLPAEIHELIRTGAEEVHVSMLSVWEIAIKLVQGRRDPIEHTSAQLLAYFEEAGFGLLPIGLRHIAAFERIPVLHRDPFDRLLVAQAEADGLVLLTHDSGLAGYGASVRAF